MIRLKRTLQRFLHFIFVYKNLSDIQKISNGYLGDIK